MRDLFLQTFRVLLSYFNSKTALITAWNILRLNGKNSITYVKTSGEIVERETTGVYTFYVSSDSNVVIRYKDSEGTKSFRLENLLEAK